MSLEVLPGILAMILVAWFWIALVVDQMPCSSACRTAIGRNTMTGPAALEIVQVGS